MSIAWQLWKRTGMPPILATLDNGRSFLLHPSAPGSAGAIYTRIYEAHYVNFMRRNLQPGGTIVDVGANIGLYALLVSQHARCLFLFEPAPDSATLLQQNMSLNDVQYELHRVAVGSRAGRAEFAIMGGYSGCNRLRLPDELGQTNVTVEVVALDDVLTHVDDLSLLKIDVEGGELGVLAGAKELLHRNPRALVQVEVTPGEHDTIRDALRGCGYSVFGLDLQGSPVALSDPRCHYRDLLACGPSHPFTASLP